jgi:DNA end-binding protein Ku
MAARGRAYWKGFLRLSLVSIPVEMFNAVESKSEISFRQIHKPSGRRVNYEKVVPGIGKIDNADIVKGYEVDKDEYIILDPEEIDAVRLESKKTLDLVQFVDAKEIDYRYFERPYFLAPADEMAGEGFVVIRDALRDTGKVGLGQVTISGREWLVAVAPLEDGIVMEMLRYADELRDPAPYFEEVPSAKPDKEMVQLAKELIAKKSAKFKADNFKDHYHTALRDLIQQKMKGRAIIAPHEEPHRGTNVVDLMSALKKSLRDSGGGGTDKPFRAKKAPAKAAAKPKAASKKKAS